jgi:hypothetical protein
MRAAAGGCCHSGDFCPGPERSPSNEQRDHALAVREPFARAGQSQIGDRVQEFFRADVAADLAIGRGGLEQ